MNKFDQRYEIRIANVNDIDMIMKFIDEHWRKDHIMSIDRELFMYEYGGIGDQINFIIAIERSTQELEAIFGFIECSRGKKEEQDIWGSMWKVNDEKDNTYLLGIELAKRVLPLTGARSHIGNGANPKTTIPLRRIFFKDQVGKMKHYYRLNSNKSEFYIAEILNRPTIDKGIEGTGKLILLNNMVEVKQAYQLDHTLVPFKDYWYIEKRYFNHPYYDYLVYGVKTNQQSIDALIVFRMLCHEGERVLRVVDYIGNQESIAVCRDQLDQLIQTNECEYMDFYCYGLNGEYLERAGFTERTEDDKNIIPNFFEPFERRNVDNWVHYKEDRTTFFKADGDQDRPNIFVEKGKRRM